jgi:hypothetical protein
MNPRKPISVCLAAGLFLLASVGTSASTIDLDSRAVAQSAAAARIPFIENDGQIDDKGVSFYARLSSGTLFVTAERDLVYSLQTKNAGWAFRESFVEGNPFRAVGADPSEIRVSQFKGSRPDGWFPQLRTYDRVELGQVYPGIRVELKAAGNNVEKLLHLSPGAQASAIKIAVEGVNALALDDRHQLLLKTGLGEIVFTAPVAYQTIDGERHAVGVRYTLLNDAYGFELGDYQTDHEVIIDPLLASTFIGGSNPSPPGNYDDDIVHGMISAGDSIYIAGATQSPDFPVHMGYDETIGGNFPDGFVTRMSSDLSTVVASTFIGTEYADRVQAIALDDAGRVVVAGQAGYGFPVTEGAYTHSGTTPTGGGFVAKFSSDLSTLVASAIPTPADYPRALARGNGGIYFGGTTNYPDFPVTPGAYRSACCPPGGFGIRPYEGFAGKISDDLTTLQAMTYLDGNAVTGIAVADDGEVFISDGFDSAITGYLARFDDGLTAREAYLSYYPGSTSGSSRTYFNDVAVSDDSVVAVGQTYMNDLPATEGAFDTTCGTDGLCDGVGALLVPHSDGFIASYAHDLQTPLALTYLGGSDHESIRAVALDATGSVVVVGETISTDFPTSSNANDGDCGTDGQCDPTGSYDTPTADVFIARLSADLSRLEYGSYLGGSEKEKAYAVALDGDGDSFVGGNTSSADFPTTPGALDNSYNGGTSDAFISKFRVTDSQGTTSSTPGETCGDGMPRMRVKGIETNASTLTLSYEPGCGTTDNNVYFGSLDDVSSYDYSGQVCGVGMSGITSFDLPSGSYFFVIVGDNDSVEGSYGRDGMSVERPAWGSCGFPQDLSDSCEQPQGMESARSTP